MRNHVHFVIPGDPATPTGGYIYDRRIVAALPAAGWQVTLHRLGDGFPLPSPAELDEAASVLAAIPDGAVTVVDGLAFGAIPDLARRESARLRLVALVHHPLALETGLPPETAARLYDSERAALAEAVQIIATSATTARDLARYGVPASRIGVVIPGTDPGPVSAGSGGGPPHLLCVATLTPRKGHDVLFEALARLADRPWRLTCAGSEERDPACAEALRRQIAALGLGQRVTLTGALDIPAVAALYHQADLFVLSSRHEGYGMVLAEALARGLPVVATAAGAIPETVPAGAGLLVPPDDPAALAATLGRLLDEPGRLAALAAGARRLRGTLPDWDTATARFAAALTAARG